MRCVIKSCYCKYEKDQEKSGDEDIADHVVVTFSFPPFSIDHSRPMFY